MVEYKAGGLVDIISIPPMNGTGDIPGMLAMSEILAGCLAASEPERLSDHRSFWTDWLTDKILGAKFTVAAICGASREDEPCTRTRIDAQVASDTGSTCLVRAAVGVCRLWQTPYLDGKWFIEGLEVVPAMRRLGLGRRLVRRCIEFARKTRIPELHAHIHDSNTASRTLFRGLGFCEVFHGYVNTYGQWRGNGSEFVRVEPHVPWRGLPTNNAS